MCTVTSATKTQIKCLTAPESFKFTPEFNLNVIVQGKLVEDAECENPDLCKFKYS